MTDSVEQDAARLLKDITSGEWTVTGQVSGWHYPIDPRRRVEAVRQSYNGPTSTHVAEYIYQPNADFIAAAPALVRGLLDQLALLRQERDEARAQIADYPEVMKTLVAIKAAHLRRFDDAHAQLTALRSAIRSIAGEITALDSNWVLSSSEAHAFAARLVILAE